MMRRTLGAIGLSVAIGFTMAIVVMQLWRVDTPNANTGRTYFELLLYGLMVICWSVFLTGALPWVVFSILSARYSTGVFVSLLSKMQAILAWKLSEARNRAHAAEQWDHHPALTDDEQATAEARKRVLDLLRDSMLIVGETECYIPSDDVLNRAFHAGNIRNHWGSGTRARALAHIRDYWFVEGTGGARQTITKRTLRVLAREVEMGSVRLVQTSANGDELTESDGPDGP